MKARLTPPAAACLDFATSATGSYSGCRQYRDEGYSACARWDRRCCTWWPCSWLCKIVTWLCVAWYWISHWVCVLFEPQRVELYLPFFYQLDVPGRASTLLHESRHIGGKPHNASFPRGSVYGAGKSGADSSWSYQGAFMYAALYLWWFYAEGQRTTTALRQSAKQRGNLIIDNAFATHPGFNIT